jgi:hypothetical protein
LTSNIKAEVPYQINKWLEPLREKYGTLVSHFVESCEIVEGHEDNDPRKYKYDLKISISYATITADASISFPLLIRLNPNDSKGTILHELGHSFGLNDTYKNKYLPGCKAGQPTNAIMCQGGEGGLNDILPDDRNGILAVADRFYPGKGNQPPCKGKIISNQSDHSYVQFILPPMTGLSIVDILAGAYNKYVFPKCNRVWWTDLQFICKGGVWQQLSGKWDADGLCHGDPGQSIFVHVGDGQAPGVTVSSASCREKIFTVKSDASYAQFVLPARPAQETITVAAGAYNKYKFPKCNRVWWSDLTFKCEDGIWQRRSGEWNADGLCHGDAGQSPYVRVGDGSPP